MNERDGGGGGVCEEYQTTRLGYEYCTLDFVPKENIGNVIERRLGVHPVPEAGRLSCKETSWL